MEELEEAMRVAGQQLHQVKQYLDTSYERETWKGQKRDSANNEIIRRALDIPFFRQLLNGASEVADLDALENEGFIGGPWREGEVRDERSSLARGPVGVDDSYTLEQDAVVPARVAAAERALQARTQSLVVVLDHLVNPRNISAIARTVEALGLHELHVIEHQGRPALERTLTTRAERWLDIVTHKSGTAAIDELRGRGYQVLAADFGEGACEVETVPISGPTALVFGSEQMGVTDEVKEKADGLFFLPNSGFTAYINVSVATAISVYALDRRMRDAGLREPLTEAQKDTLRPAWYTMLARGDMKKEAEYLAWAKRPPTQVSSDKS